MVEQGAKVGYPKFKWDRNQRDYHRYKKMKLAKLMDLEMHVKFAESGKGTSKKTSKNSSKKSSNISTPKNGKEKG